MRWVIIDRIHMNTDTIECFHWIEGRLYIRYPDKNTLTFRDPDKKKYLQLCAQLGLRPAEEDSDGEG